MLLEKERQLFVGEYSKIDNLTDKEREIIEISEEYAWDQLEFIANYSSGILDMADYNFGTSSYILRFNLRLKNNEEFKTNIGYIGILFEAIEMVNAKVYLEPAINTQLN